MRILITGSCGFIGRYAVERLLKDGHEIWGADIKDCPPKEHDNYNYSKIDLTDKEALEGLLNKSKENNIELIIHLAAIATPVTYTQNPLKTMNVDLLSSLAISQWCQKENIPMVFTSTSEVYGVNPELPWSEDSRRVLGPPQEDRWCYSTSKAAVEHYIRTLHKDNPEWNYLIIRLFNVYGKGLEGRVFDYFFKELKENKNIVIYGNGEQIRCFTYIDDFMDALMGLIDNGCWNDVFNIGNPEQHTINEVVRIMGSILCKDIPVEYREHEFPDIVQRVPDVKKVMDRIGWKPKHSLREGLCKTMEEEGLI